MCYFCITDWSLLISLPHTCGTQSKATVMIWLMECQFVSFDRVFPWLPYYTNGTQWIVNDSLLVYYYANLKVPPPCQMKKMGTITAINFHVSLVIFTVTYFRNIIYLNYHIISAHILLLQVFVCFNVTFNNLLVSSFMLSTFVYIFFFLFSGQQVRPLLPNCQ